MAARTSLPRALVEPWPRRRGHAARRRRLPRGRRALRAKSSSPTATISAMSDDESIWDEIDRLYEESARRNADERVHNRALAVDDDMPVDPDLDHLPPELRHRPGPFTISGVDR